MNQAIALTENSFKITGRGIILELKHTQKGLAKATKLISENTDKVWKVKARILFDHAVEEQKIFETESTEYALVRFESPEKRQESIDAIKERESQNIYQYLVEPIGHEDKPKQGEKLNLDENI